LALKSVKPSNRTEGKIQRTIRRYHQAKTNAMDSVDALARFLRLAATARLYANRQPATVSAHSLGAHFLQYSLEIVGSMESLSAAQNVVLLAPCTRAAGHKEWLSKVHPKGQVFVTFNAEDAVLFGAFVADGSQMKLGVEPGSDLLDSRAVRYVSFTRAAMTFGGHRYFVAESGQKLQKRALKLFGRMFRSLPDFELSEHPNDVYLSCDADRLTCYMAAPADPSAGGPS